ncbi:complex III assembly factor LYRM7 [Hylaeus volcanicus]|uniref:complex III assembly factor LYRM7 n=1 Tax=Hylaeus volcanicus TaxID=313075 RepID=UPI0023B780C1|nr:complex III assembly factor LYRM7 [Hylaeus volcanicus]
MAPSSVDPEYYSRTHLSAFPPIAPLSSTKILLLFLDNNNYNFSKTTLTFILLLSKHLCIKFIRIYFKLEMGGNLRRQVLCMFKKLHRTRMNTFKGDEHALKVVRNKINEEYKKNKNVTNTAAIEELNKFAQEVEHEVRTTVIQAVEKEPGKFALNITPDIKLMDNVPCEDLKKTSSEDRPRKNN